MTTIEKAKESFSQGFNCSQTVFSLFSEKYGVPFEIARKIGCGFGGGMRYGEVCGAVTGALMVISLRYGHNEQGDNESKQLCYAKTKEFIEAFKQRQNTIVCRELLGCDISTEEGMNKAIDQNLFKTTCVDMICEAVALLEELGY